MSSMIFKIQGFGILISVIVLGMLTLNEEVDAGVIRTHRDLLSFSMMATFKTGRSALEFNNYGRYCGLFGSGTIVDEVDQCCSTHDKCYDIAVSEVGPCEQWGGYGPYWIKYKWTSHPNGTVECVQEDLRTYKFADCAYFVCECDNEVTSCFAKYGYNPANQKTLMWRVVENELVSKFNLTVD